MPKDDIKVFRELCTEVQSGQADNLWGKFYRALEQKNLLDTDYADNTDGKSIDDVKRDIPDMNFSECCTWLTWILRGERFSEGLFQSCIDDDSVLSLLKRSVEILESENKE